MVVDAEKSPGENEGSGDVTLAGAEGVHPGGAGEEGAGEDDENLDHERRVVSVSGAARFGVSFGFGEA